jgi:hypothetical protein
MGVGVVFPIEKLMFVKVFEKKTKNQFLFWACPAGLHGWRLTLLVSKGWSQIDSVAAKRIRGHYSGCYAGLSCKTNGLDISNIGSYFLFFKTSFQTSYRNYESVFCFEKCFGNEKKIVFLLGLHIKKLIWITIVS